MEKKTMQEAGNKQNRACCLFLACFLHGFLFDPEDAGNTFLQNQATWYYIPEGSTLKYRIFVENFQEETT
jgi:hypothetical protein